MKTLPGLLRQPSTIPLSTAWYLFELGQYYGKQGLYIHQSPQRLKSLREHALIESSVCSNRIEGIAVEPSRVRTVLATQVPLFHDRNEEELRGYRDALTWIHHHADTLSLDEATVQHLHAMTRGQMLALAAFNLDFLCIHPFRDGNGRVSRLLWLLQSDQLGYQVGRYISLERLVEQNKDRYYETLEQSSQGWHDGKHDPWPYINYVLSIMKLAYHEFFERVGDIEAPRGSKRDLVLAGVAHFSIGSGFTLGDLESRCPGVSRDMVRHVLREQQTTGIVACHGRGPAARWYRKR
ncbi:MAG: Fic family protein [Magnetococcales bacterium]|nr:Fic family protein [Magnetococcales bacterium]